MPQSVKTDARYAPSSDAWNDSDIAISWASTTAITLLAKHSAGRTLQQVHEQDLFFIQVDYVYPVTNA